MFKMFKMQDGKFDMMLFASLFVTLIYYTTTPAMWVRIYQVLTPNMVSIQHIALEASSIIFGLLWAKFSDKLYKQYGKILFVEAFFAAVLLVITWTSLNLVHYYIMDSACIALSTNNVVSGNRKLKAKRYQNEEARNKFDQMNSVCGSIGAIGGSMIGIFIQQYVPLEWMITIYLVASLTDNLCYYCIYRKMQKENTESVNA